MYNINIAREHKQNKNKKVVIKMTEISLNNGVSYINVVELDTVKEQIIEYWEELVNLMDSEDMEIANLFTDAHTETKKGKIEYLKDYLSIAKENLILG